MKRIVIEGKPGMYGEHFPSADLQDEEGNSVVAIIYSCVEQDYRPYYRDGAFLPGRRMRITIEILD